MRFIVISATSDIGAAMCLQWLDQGHEVFGTYCTHSQTVSGLENKGAALLQLDIASASSVDAIAKKLNVICMGWDVLVLAPGTQKPVGLFQDTDPDAWATSLNINFVHQWRLVHRLLSSRNREHPLGPCVLFFAGGGSNNSVLHYSAYTVSKIACIKMCELLDAEIPDTRFSIVGPGWVKTKIHHETLAAGAQAAGDNYERTKAKLAADDFVPMQKVLDSCDWIISQPRDVVGGRNFSTEHDDWGSDDLVNALHDDPNMYKLRRHGNAWRPPAKD